MYPLWRFMLVGLKSWYGRAELAAIRKFGTRGVFLLILALMWLLLGIGYGTNRMERFSRVGPGGWLDFLDRGFFFYLLAYMWVAGALAAIVAAARRPMTCDDSWGFIGLTIPPFLWGVAYWASWLAYLFSEGAYGRPRTYTAAVLFWSITIMVVFLSRHLRDHPEGPCARRLSGKILQ
jgi:hypothetical protein